MFRRKFIIFLIIFCGVSAKAQLDLEHWFPPISWFPKKGLSPELYQNKIYLSTPHKTPFLVKLFDGNTLVTSFMLSRSSPVVYDVSSDMYFTGDKFLFQAVTRGLHFAGANSFYASYRISTSAGDEIITSKGKTAIGKHFFIGGAPSEVEDFGEYFASIYATKNNTKVTVSNKQNRIIFADGQTHPQFSFILNKGESYALKVRAKDNYSTDPAQIPYAFNNDVYNSFLGAEITADQPVAVMNGNYVGQITADFNSSANLLYDQSLPVKNLGQSYFLRMGFSTLRGGSEGALIIATEDNTKVYFNDDAIPIILNKGQYYSTIFSKPNKFIEHDPLNVDPQRNYGLYVRSSAKVYCYQFTAGTGNIVKIIGYLGVFCQSMSLVLPLDATLPGTVDFVPKFSKIGSTRTLDTRLNIYLPKGQIPAINDVLADVSSGPFNIKGTDDYKYFQVKIPKNTFEDLKVSANSGLVLNILNGHEIIAPNDEEDVLGFASHYTGFSNDPYIIKKGNCIQEDVLLALNNNDFEGFQWQKNGVDIPGANSPTYMPLLPGSYTCVLSYSTFTYITDPIQVDDCPYVISTTDLGNICPNFLVSPNFSAPNQNLNFVKLEILTQPNNGSAVIENNLIKVTNNIGFTGNDRLVYKITAGNGFYEVVKVNFSVFANPIADVKSEIVNDDFFDSNYIYNLSSAINNTNAEEFHYYLTQKDAENQDNEIFTFLAFTTKNPTIIFVRVSTTSGCFVIKKILLVKKPPPPVIEVNLPNAFTPNGDGINDVWDYALLKDFSNLKLAIFDRYGRKVYERLSDSEDYFWEGKNDINSPLPTGTYWVFYSYTLKNSTENISKSMWLLLKNRN